MAQVVIRNATIVGDLAGEDTGQPPGIWGPTDPRPTPPIVIPIPPDAIGPGVPAHPIWLPVYPAHPIVIPPGAISPGHPEHPIVLPPYVPAHPIVIPPDVIAPGVPAHPIVLPPTVWPPLNPPGIWGGGNAPMPTPPIALPPKPTEPPSGGGNKPPPATGGWGYVNDPGFGWGYFPAQSDKPHPPGGEVTPPPDPNAPSVNPLGRR